MWLERGKLEGRKLTLVKKASSWIYRRRFSNGSNFKFLRFTSWTFLRKVYLHAADWKLKDCLLRDAVRQEIQGVSSHNHAYAQANLLNRSIYDLMYSLMQSKLFKIILRKADKYNFAFDDLKNYLGYKKNMKKIEAYDISHISGNHAVASCIVFSNEGPSKKEYRTFNIPKELSGNDVGSLEHVIQRRLKYYDNKDTKPDLILIDGGTNQLNFSNSVIHNSEHNDIKVISIVKGINRIRATETVLSQEGIIEFNKESKGYLLLQEIRDESHRFAINAQRKRKNAQNRKSKLDNIEGIGEVLKKRLLLNFKSIKNIKLAKLEDLMTVKGINAKIARSIMKDLK